MVLISNKPVKIKGREFRGATTVAARLQASMTEHPLEADETRLGVIASSIGNEPRQFKVTAVLYDEVDVVGVIRFEKGKRYIYKDGHAYSPYLKVKRQESYDFLESIWNKREVFKFVCDFGSFDSCVMVSASFKETSDSKSTYEAEIEIRQIQVVKYKPTSFQFVVDSDGNLIGTSANTSAGDNIYLTAPKKSSSGDDRDAAERAWDWMQDTRPGWVFDKKGDGFIGVF